MIKIVKIGKMDKKNNNKKHEQGLSDHLYECQKSLAMVSNAFLMLSFKFQTLNIIPIVAVGRQVQLKELVLESLYTKI